MSLVEKAEQFDALVEKADRPDYVSKMVELADKIDNKLNKLAQTVETFPAPSGGGVNAPYVPGTEPVPQPAPPAPKFDRATVELLKSQVDALFASLLK
jgi:hypothetical protein